MTAAPTLARDEALAGGVTRCFAARRPALLRGLARDWPLMTRWSVDALVARLGDYRCKVTRDSRPALSDEHCSLREYFGERHEFGTITFEGVAEHGALPGFMDDVPLPNACFTREQLSAVFFFHAAAGMGALPHCHEDAFNVLHSGRKRWLLYDADPDEAPRGDAILRRCHAEYGAGTHARDWFVDPVAGPEALRRAGLEVYEFEQGPGDVVYIPQRFAHAVLNLDESMGVVGLVARPDREYQREPGGGFSPHGARVG